MFKCTECGQIFQTKPEYCSCGNNEFTEIPEPTPKNPQFAAKQDTLAPNKGQTASWCIFGICILLSAAVWMFAWNNPPKQKTETPLINTEKTTMPDIDEIWKD